jgi:hypothetical protein
MHLKVRWPALEKTSKLCAAARRVLPPLTT